MKGNNSLKRHATFSSLNGNNSITSTTAECTSSALKKLIQVCANCLLIHKELTEHLSLISIAEELVANMKKEKYTLLTLLSVKPIVIISF